ncbi:MAG: beta-ketoacyl-ACP synthase II [Deltaproteobacteria bacterium]|nr:beta-ketoacyl-ACP synthase II [Deltaproteobacteria bacterium]
MPENKKRRVVITGLGVIACNGIGKEAFWNALKEGQSGIKRITRFDASSYPSQVAGEVLNFDPMDYMSPKSIKRMDRFSQFAVTAAKMAIEDSGITISQNNNSSIGIVFASAIGGMDFAESQHSLFMEKGLQRTSPYLAISLFSGAASSQIAIELGVTGYNNTLSTACAAGGDAIGHAFHAIRNNLADVIIGGGAECPLAPLTFASFCIINGLSTQRNKEPWRASRPFDGERDGFVMSEGAGAVILEELTHALDRGAHIYAEIIGYGTTCDAYHMTQPSPDGRGTVKAIQIALDDANIKLEEVDYINAHGTSTRINDSNETKIIKQVFGETAYKIPLSSNKSMTGHSLGASPAIEMVASALTIENQFLPPTINQEHSDPECDLDYLPNIGRKARVNTILSNSLGFGGKNVALIIRNFSETVERK